MIDREKLREHPGWSVRFSNGEWLGGAHGWYTSKEAAYADVYDSEEEAHSTLKYVRDNHKEHDSEFSLAAEIIPAWEPLCETLRVRIHFLKEANTITPNDIDSVVFSLEDAIRTLQPRQKK